MSFHNSVQISMQIYPGFREYVPRNTTIYQLIVNKLREQDRSIFTGLCLMTANFEGTASNSNLSDPKGDICTYT